MERLRQEPASPAGNRSGQISSITGAFGLSSLHKETMPTALGGLAAVLIWLLAVLPAWPASYYSQRLEDPKAVYVAGPSGGDDAAAIQQAIDRVQETGGQGIVLLGQAAIASAALFTSGRASA